VKARIEEKIWKTVLWVISFSTLAILLVILFYILSRGLKMINYGFLTETPRAMGREGGIYPAILGTVYFVILTLILAVPLGVAAAVQLTEYSRESLLVKIIRFGNESLAAVPSIVFGLFGFALFVVKLKPYTGGYSILSGSLTGTLMILPILIRATEEAIKAVPREYREASYALGATHWQTVTRIVLPAAAPGIITAVILGIGRIVGETAALLLTLGGSVLIPTSIFAPARTLALHIYLVAMEVGAMDMAFGTAAVLILTVLALNLSAYFLRRHFLSIRGAK